jgi:uncharacterized lipoprotein NlpE involved in copper resistance
MRKAIMVAMVATLALCGCSGGGNAIIRESENGTVNVNRRFISNGPRDNFETVVDSETGVTYLVWTRLSGESSKGGITPLLDKDGKVVISEEVGE